jgi:putative endonuclease
MMKYYVYVLYSEKTNTFYKGQTNDISDRVRRHNSGTNRSTKPGIPWILIWFAEKRTRSQALNLERKLKNMSREKLIKFMSKYYEGFAGPDALILTDQWSGC